MYSKPSGKPAGFFPIGVELHRQLACIVQVPTGSLSERSDEVRIVTLKLFDKGDVGFSVELLRERHRHTEEVLLVASSRSRQLLGVTPPLHELSNDFEQPKPVAILVEHRGKKRPIAQGTNEVDDIDCIKFFAPAYRRGSIKIEARGEYGRAREHTSFVVVE